MELRMKWNKNVLAADRQTDRNRAKTAYGKSFLLHFHSEQGFLYTISQLEIFSVIATHGASAHFYADIGQMYVNSPVDSPEDAISQFADCIRNVAAWIGANWLRLNSQKTQLIRLARDNSRRT